MKRRIKTLYLSHRILKQFGLQISCYGAIHVVHLLKMVKQLVEDEKLPPDVAITWVWYDPPYGCFGMILWSETFDIVPEGEIPPVLEL